MSDFGQISALLSLNIVNNRQKSGKFFLPFKYDWNMSKGKRTPVNFNYVSKKHNVSIHLILSRVRWRNVISVYPRSVPGVMSKCFCWYTLQIIDISCAPSVFLHRQCKIFPPFAGTEFVPNSLDEFQSRITHTRNVSLSVSRVSHGSILFSCRLYLFLAKKKTYRDRMRPWFQYR